MSNKRLIIVGGVAGGASAAAHARRLCEDCETIIPGSINIPLDELRQRLNELPRDREIIAYCQSGQRSYNAARILSQHGFRVSNLTGSYRTWRAAQPQ